MILVVALHAKVELLVNAKLLSDGLVAVVAGRVLVLLLLRGVD
jgi:hypothetical protein